MKVLGPLVAWSLVLVPVVAGAESRLRLENSGPDGQVRIVQSDEVVRTVEISMPGLSSGEMVIVEAPAERVRLKGGRIQADPLLEAVVEQKLRASSTRAPTVSVLPAPPRFALEPRRYVNHVFTDVGFAYWPAYDWLPSTRLDDTGRGYRRPRATRSSHSPPAPRGSYSSRGMMPRR